MPNIVAVQLDHISESQLDKEEVANANFDALSSAALYGVKSLAGLVLTLYGGNIILGGAPTAVATQSITLSDNSTNYVYDLAGVFTKATTAPTGWPGPITVPSGALALYRLVTVAGFVDLASSVVYVPSLGVPGIPGIQGLPGPPAVDLPSQRLRWFQYVGAGTSAFSDGSMGWQQASSGLSPSARSLAATPFRATIPYVAALTAVGTGQSGYNRSAQVWCYRGDVAGRGGFTFAPRFCLESALSPTNFRMFFGLAPAAFAGGNVEPDTFIDCVGVGCKGGDANLSIIHNDASGTATMVPLGANFPARATDNVYELTLTAAANAATIDYRLVDCETQNVASGTLSSNLPTNTTFLEFVYWLNTGSSATPAAAIGIMQIVGTTRW